MRRVLVPAVIMAALAGHASAQTMQIAQGSQPAPSTSPSSSPADAAYNAGLKAYSEGDFPAATRNWRQAAQAGDPRAQFRLGQMFEQGKGAIQSRVQAHAWYNIAASQGHEEAAQSRDRIAKTLTAEQLADAERQANAFQPTSAASASNPPAPAPVTTPVATTPVSIGTAQELYKAAEVGDVAKIKSLLAGGVNVNEADGGGWTALFFAVFKQQTDAVRTLIDAKANVNAKGKVTGETPLMVAVTVGSSEVVRMLVAAKADQTAKDTKGRAARDIAELKGEKQVMAILKPVQSSKQVVDRGALSPASLAPTKPTRVDIDWINGRWDVAASLPKPCPPDGGYIAFAIAGGVLRWQVHLWKGLDSRRLELKIRNDSRKKRDSGSPDCRTTALYPNYAAKTGVSSGYYMR